MASKLLTATEVKNAKATGKLFRLPDGEGLFLEVTPTGKKHWRYRYSFNGKESMCSLGQYDDVTLQDARAERDRLRKDLRVRGVNPARNRQRGRGGIAADDDNSYQAVAKRWIKIKKSGKKWSDGYLAQVERTLEDEVFPEIGTMKFSAVTATDLTGILDAIVERQTAAAEKKGKESKRSVPRLIQQWFIAIGKFGALHQLTDQNTAAALQGYVSSSREVRHHPYLKESELEEFFKKVSLGRGTESVRLAVLLLAHTFVRPSELRCASWSEFDFDNAIWTVPAKRMKMREEHDVPLTSQSMILLRRLREINPHPRLLFPNTRDSTRCMSPTTLNRYLERLGYGGRLSAHGFRGTAMTILITWGERSDAIEKQLAHALPSRTQQAYNHAVLTKERAAMMQKWSVFLESQGARHSPDTIEKD